MAKPKEKKSSTDKVHKKKANSKITAYRGILKVKSELFPNSQKTRDESRLSPRRGSRDLEEKTFAVKGGGSEYSKEFPSIEEGIVQEAKSKSRKKEKQDLKRKERALEISDKAQQKLKKKAAKEAAKEAAKTAIVVKPEPEPEVKPIIHGLTPPKNIRALALATHPEPDDVSGQAVLLVENQQQLSKPDKKEEKRLRRLKRVEKREDKSIVVPRSKSLEKLAGLINKRDEKYSGAKFAALLGLAEKILVVDEIPGATIDQKANKVTKDIEDMGMQIEQLEPEAESNTALVLRKKTPENPSANPNQIHPDRLAITSSVSVEPIHCRWKKCGKKFDALKDLFTHVCDQHAVGTQSQTTQKCRWNHCKADINETNKRPHCMNHMHNDFCDWNSDRHGSLVDHVKNCHLEQLTTVAKAKESDSKKRKRGQNDDTGNAEVLKKSSKKRKLGSVASAEEILSKPSKKRKLETDAGSTLPESANPKSKKRKHGEEPAENSKDKVNSRPMKKMKKSHKN